MSIEAIASVDPQVYLNQRESQSLEGSTARVRDLSILSAAAEKHVPDLKWWVRGLATRPAMDTLGLTLEDLQQDAFLALEKADREFDPAQSTDSAAYFHSRVRWKVVDKIREDSEAAGMSRVKLKWAKQVRTAQETLWQRCGSSDIDPTAISEEVGLSTGQVTTALQYSIEVESLEATLDVEQAVPLKDTIPDCGPTPEQQCLKI